MQLVNQEADNPGIEYSYTVATLPRKAPTKKDNPTAPGAIPPSNIQVSMSNVPSQRRSNNIAISNVRIIDSSGRTDRRSRYDTKPKTPSNNVKSPPQYVYENRAQVIGGESSIRENKYNGNEQIIPNRAPSIRTRPSGLISPSNLDLMEKRRHNSEMLDLARSTERYVWTHGRWTPCSNNCGSGKFLQFNKIKFV